MTVAEKTFIRYNDKFLAGPTERIPQGHISLHLDERRLPPMGDDLVRKSVAVVPMTFSEWQDVQDPENTELDPEQGKFRWDGSFVPNPQVLGHCSLDGGAAPGEGAGGIGADQRDIARCCDAAPGPVVLHGVDETGIFF